jgi:hypothetical protein
MRAFTVDVKGRDVEAGLMACILRIACADAAGLSECIWKAGSVISSDTWQKVSGGKERRTSINTVPERKA